MTTNDVTDNSRIIIAKQGTPGHVHITICRKALISHIASMVDGLRAVQSAVQIVKVLDSVLPQFKGGGSYEIAFPLPTDTAAEPCGLDDDAVAASHGAELPDEGQTEADRAERLKKGVCKSGCQGVDLFYDLMGGRYGAAINKIGQQTPAPAIVWTDVDGLDAVRVRLVSIHKSVEGGPPLKRNKKVEDMHESRTEEVRKDRNEIWKQATMVGRKCAPVGHCRYTAKAHLHKHFEKCSTVFKFTDKVGEQHRGFRFLGRVVRGARRKSVEHTGRVVRSGRLHNRVHAGSFRRK